MLSKLTQEEKEEIVFNALVLKQAVKIIAGFNDETSEDVLAFLVDAAELELQQLSEAQINNIIATNDKVRADIASQTNTPVIHVVLMDDK